jgi:hypothetical protein
MRWNWNVPVRMQKPRTLPSSVAGMAMRSNAYERDYWYDRLLLG